MNKDINAYHKSLSKEEQAICIKLYEEIDSNLKGAENKIWHRHPVWFFTPLLVFNFNKSIK